ncbi:MAG: hypothetical protein AAFY26_26830 [Cyanobacteria bacterium J06638_22]
MMCFHRFDGVVHGGWSDRLHPSMDDGEEAVARAIAFVRERYRVGG